MSSATTSQKDTAAVSTEQTQTNGSAAIAPRHQHEKVRVAIIGVGNCASSFVQGVHYYRNADPGQQVPGLMHVDLGGYHVRDIEVVAAFDIDAAKVGEDVGKAIWAGTTTRCASQTWARLGPKCCVGRPSTASASTTARRS